VCISPEEVAFSADVEGGEAGSEWRRIELAADEPKLATLRFVPEVLWCLVNRLPDNAAVSGIAANKGGLLAIRGLISSNWV
jgi:hypothetical protein